MSEEVNITIELVKLAIRFEEKGECHIKKITLEQMLDLYQKEKEENIKLTNTIKYLNEEKERSKELLNEKESVFDKGYFEGTKDGEEAIRDEIRAIIKEYYERKSIPDLVISRIEDLLEEQENENSIK